MIIHNLYIPHWNVKEVYHFCREREREREREIERERERLFFPVVVLLSSHPVDLKINPAL